jgi:CDP-glucose 4,6-dehydratase
VDLNPELWRNRRVLVTGHTGFKGSWLVFWLSQFGAEIIGISLPASEQKHSLYSDAKISKLLSKEFFLDIRNETLVQDAMKESKPDYVFHLAAQAIVSRSVRDPNESITTNVVGTSNILLTALSLNSILGITIATTDKVYQNIDNNKPFQETDALGSKDPYSASKAAAEIVVASLASVCNPRKIPITTVRAGNVIGGGDWGEDRLVPDLVNALNSNRTMIVRNINATRPWQHVLDCLRGYLLIAQSHLVLSTNTPISINFGPNESLSVKQLINIFESHFEKSVNYKVVESILNEAQYLKLDSELAFRYLNWSPFYKPYEAISKTAKWYLDYLHGNNALELVAQELLQYPKVSK